MKMEENKRKREVLEVRRNRSWSDDKGNLPEMFNKNQTAAKVPICKHFRRSYFICFLILRRCQLLIIYSQERHNYPSSSLTDTNGYARHPPVDFPHRKYHITS